MCIQRSKVLNIYVAVHHTVECLQGIFMSCTHACMCYAYAAVHHTLLSACAGLQHSDLPEETIQHLVADSLAKVGVRMHSTNLRLHGTAPKIHKDEITIKDRKDRKDSAWLVLCSFARRGKFHK